MGSEMCIRDRNPIGAAANPTALSIPATIDQYTKMLSEAAEYTTK